MSIDNPLNIASLSCPVPKSRYGQILLGHGSGEQLTSELIDRLFVPGFGGDLGGLEGMDHWLDYLLKLRLARHPEHSN